MQSTNSREVLPQLFVALVIMTSGALSQIDESGNLEDGIYMFGSLSQEAVFLTSKEEWTRIPMRLGNVTSERYAEENADEMMWRVSKATYNPNRGPFQLRHILTQGQFSMNNVDLELPRGSTYPVWHYWRVIYQRPHLVQIRSLLIFDWGGVGDNKCLQHNGNGTRVTFEECNTDNWTQSWIVISYPEIRDLSRDKITHIWENVINFKT